MFINDNLPVRKKRDFKDDINFFRVDCEYKILTRKKTKDLGINGKVCRIREILREEESCYAQVDSDIYKLKLSDLSTKIVSGRYRVNMSEILSTKLLKGLDIDYGSKTTDEWNKYLERFGVELHRVDGSLPYIELRADNLKLVVGPISYIEELKGHRMIFFPKGNSRVETVFENATKKDVWTILKTLVYMELPLCPCGSKQQYWMESLLDLTVEIRCECGEILYCSHNTYIDTDVEAPIAKLFEMNKNL